MLNQVRENVGTDLVAEESLEHRSRRSAGPEAFELGLTLHATEGAVELRGHGLDRHLDGELAPRRIHFLDRQLHAYSVSPLSSQLGSRPRSARGGTRTPIPCGARS
jgi:hypothetical protein